MKTTNSTNLENHMVLNGPDAPWNREDMPEWECTCGADHSTDVKRLGYPKWHSLHKYVYECAMPKCPNRCCHDCGTTCALCGQSYCPDHSGVEVAGAKLCSDCGEGYEGLSPEILDDDVRELIAIEGRRCSGVSLSRRSLSDSEVAWLILKLQEAPDTKWRGDCVLSRNEHVVLVLLPSQGFPARKTENVWQENRIATSDYCVLDSEYQRSTRWN